MYNIKQSTFVLILLFIVTIFSLAYFYVTMNDQLIGKMGNFFQVITTFSMLVGIVITIMTFTHQLTDREKTNSLQYANITQSALNDIDKIFMNNPLLDRLYLEMYANTPHIQEIKQLKKSPNVTSELLKQEHHMANIIFQKMSDVYFCEQLDTCQLKDSVEWINTFRRWMQSPILRSHWVNLKMEHHPDAQRYVDQVIIGGENPQTN